MKPECEFEPTITAADLADMIAGIYGIPVYTAIANEGLLQAVPIQDCCQIDGKMYIGTKLSIEALLKANKEGGS